MKKEYSTEKFYGHKARASAEIRLYEEWEASQFWAKILFRTFLIICAISVSVLLIRASVLDTHTFADCLDDVDWPPVFIAGFFMCISVVCVEATNKAKKAVEESRPYWVEVPVQIINITSEKVKKADGGTRTKHTAWGVYEYDGVIYSDVELSYYSSSMSVGATVNMKIDTRRPYETVQENSAGVFMVCAVMFFLPALIPLLLGLLGVFE